MPVGTLKTFLLHFVTSSYAAGILRQKVEASTAFPQMKLGLLVSRRVEVSVPDRGLRCCGARSTGEPYQCRNWKGECWHQLYKIAYYCVFDRYLRISAQLLPFLNETHPMHFLPFLTHLQFLHLLLILHVEQAGIFHPTALILLQIFLSTSSPSSAIS